MAKHEFGIMQNDLQTQNDSIPMNRRNNGA